MVEPGAISRHEVQMPTRTCGQPGVDLGMLVSGVIVDDQMQLALGWGFAVDLVEEADELLMPMAAHALADDLTV